MARYLFCAWPFAGHVHPCMSVALELRKQGHAVAFYTGAPFRSSVEQEGFLFFPFRRTAATLAGLIGASDATDHAALYPRVTKHYSTTGLGPVQRAQKISAMFRQMLVGTIPDQFSDIGEIVREWRPDALISDAMMWGPGLLVHDKLRIPVAVFSFYAGCLIPGPGMPPLGLGLSAGRRWHTRLTNHVLAEVANQLSSGLRAEIDRMRRSEGLPALSRAVLAHQGELPLYLVASVPELDYCRQDLPGSVRYVGPCLWDRHAGTPDPDWVRELRPDPPVIYVSEGTAQLGEPLLLRLAIEALGDSSCQVIVTTGPQRALQLSGLPPNVRIEQWVPHSALFSKASMIVTNGGSGTVRQALLAGVPLLIAPMEWDQLENAQRVADAGAGIRIRAAGCTVPTLRKNVDKILGSPDYRANAGRIAKLFTEAGQANYAASLIQQIPRSRN